MRRDITVDQVWWRNVQKGEFYNIEREHKIDGGGGSLYIEIPSSLVEETLEFLERPRSDLQDGEPIIIDAFVFADPQKSAPIEFRTKKGNRMRIARQNRRQPGSLRHPAWTSEYGFPQAPDNLRANKADFVQYFPEGGLRIFIVKSIEGDYFAGFTKGPRPSGLPIDDPNSELYPSSSRIPGGLIKR